MLPALLQKLLHVGRPLVHLEPVDVVVQLVEDPHARRRQQPMAQVCGRPRLLRFDRAQRR